MAKKYFIKRRTIEQAERMAEKYKVVAEEMEYDLITGSINEDKEHNFKVVEKLRDKAELINITIYNCCEGCSYKGTWEDIKVLRNAEINRDILDGLM